MISVFWGTPQFHRLACLSPLMSTNVRAGASSTIYATDASLGKEAIVETEVAPGPELSRLQWDACDKQGHYTMLDSPFRELLKHVGEDHEDEEEGKVSVPDPEKQSSLIW